MVIGIAPLPLLSRSCTPKTSDCSVRIRSYCAGCGSLVVKAPMRMLRSCRRFFTISGSLLNPSTKPASGASESTKSNCWAWIENTSKPTIVVFGPPLTSSAGPCWMLGSLRGQWFSDRPRNSGPLVHESRGCRFANSWERNSAPLPADFTRPHSATCVLLFLIVSPFATEVPKRFVCCECNETLSLDPSEMLWFRRWTWKTFLQSAASLLPKLLQMTRWMRSILIPSVWPEQSSALFWSHKCRTF